MIPLKEGEIVCNDCNGCGEINIFEDDEDIYYENCSKCKGTGKLDWIENIVGKKEESIIWGQRTLNGERKMWMITTS